jgi:hypothetical protein
MNEKVIYQTEAIHFAILFSIYNVLTETNESENTILKNEKLNFNFLLKQYVKLFSHTNSIDSISYYYLIKNENIRNKFIVDLIIESNDIDSIIGCFKSNEFKEGIQIL